MARPKRNTPEFSGVETAQAFRAGGEAQRDVLAKYTTSPWDYSKGKVYAIAKAFGWESGRKRRADKGSIRVEGVSLSDVERFAEVLLETTHFKTGKRLASTEDLQQQMVLNGYEGLQNASISSINRWLRDNKLNHEQLLAGNPAIQMRALHPNHIHFVDASICVQWDLNNGKKLVPRDMKKAFYKNKPGYWKKVRKVLIRWMLVDHCSGAFYVDYSYAQGENTADLLNFLLDGWGKKAYASRYPFQGVPRRLGMNPGAANTSHEVGMLAEKLGIALEVHQPGNSRASGVVEQMHDFWERRFEFELLLEAADDLEDLRHRAHDRMVYLNATAKHSRHGKTRSSKWMEITQEQLRLRPPKEHCKKLATSKPEKRTPNELLRISFEGKSYQLSAPALKKVAVFVNHDPWQVDELNIWTEDGEAVPCKLIATDQHGYSTTAPVYGEGEYQRHADTPAQAIKKAVEGKSKEERRAAFRPQTTSHLVPEQHFMPRRGTDIVLNELPKAPPTKAVEVAAKLRRDLGIGRITPLMRQQLDGWLAGREILTGEDYAAIKTKAGAQWLNHNKVPPALERKAG